MSKISKEEIKEIVIAVARPAFWLCVGIIAYAGLVRWIGG
tara:strand:- start:70 stop:189 length:120 start_codon:yes stop_codon:yes gene_type:complete